ncbi:hypothetical protein F4820DRAFT_430917 [Hypoxylon rubiginosum]|uniref:Uncharacterized protein n=1 Tax=Hypoxylon rubiginosum TaxID=110542 RepID=A0ACB9YSG9_9PEZI|nr:hypothetical protein F4820DRAFT_430917 [Hypoxylon rubiginosum]
MAAPSPSRAYWRSTLKDSSPSAALVFSKGTRCLQSHHPAGEAAYFSGSSPTTWFRTELKMPSAPITASK